MSLSISFFLYFSFSFFLSLHSPDPAVPPRFVKKVRAVPFVEGEDAQITCTIEGAPYPRIRWARQLGAGVEVGRWPVLGLSCLKNESG